VGLITGTLSGFPTEKYWYGFPPAFAALNGAINKALQTALIAATLNNRKATEVFITEILHWQAQPVYL
jgi:hypothetical protein